MPSDGQPSQRTAILSFLKITWRTLALLEEQSFSIYQIELRHIQQSFECAQKGHGLLLLLRTKQSHDSIKFWLHDKLFIILILSSMP